MVWSVCARFDTSGVCLCCVCVCVVELQYYNAMCVNAASGEILCDRFCVMCVCVCVFGRIDDTAMRSSK